VRILPRINGTPGGGFAELVTRKDGSVQRVGALELRSPDSAQLRSMIERREPLVYSGPAWVDGGWVEASFPVVVTSVAPARDVLTRFSIAESDGPSMTGPSDSDVAA
jgi:hypothetical protein